MIRASLVMGGGRRKLVWKGVGDSRLLDKRGSWVTMSSGSWRRPSLRASWSNGNKIMIRTSLVMGGWVRGKLVWRGLGTADCLTTGDGGSHVIGFTEMT